MMALSGRKIAKILLLAIGAVSFYLLATHKHAEREDLRQAAVSLTPACAAKLSQYALERGDYYRSPYVVQRTGATISLRGYSDEDVRAIQRGCNIVDDLQGSFAKSGTRERWNADRFVRGSQTTCNHCHQGIGDKQDAAGNRLIGSNHLGASWAMADMYDRFTGLLLSHELRQMQCFINSSNGFKPNVADDVIRDIVAYSRFLAAALDMKIGKRYAEQGIDEVPASATLRRGDDYVRGAHLYRQNCAVCHGAQAFGTVAQGRVIAPALAGPNAFSLDSRMNFTAVNTVMAGFICRNMPPGRENTLAKQDCRDIAFYISNLPRAAGDRQGPIIALKQQLLMAALPPLLKLTQPNSAADEAGGKDISK